jgi:aspartyl-tRNA(Asn)/glutamyl-tRNA(Gln) amidotransferase subunit B
MNSFRAVYRALEFEAKRQRKAVADDRKLVQETRGWVEEKGKTVAQRSKEYAHDYRYFPEPDLPPLVLDRNWVEEIRSKLPELPAARRDRFMAQYNLSFYDANLLTSSRAMADYFEDCLKTEEYKKLPQDRGPKEISNWLLGEVSRIMNARNSDIVEIRKTISPRQFVVFISEYLQGIVSSTSGKSVLEEMSWTGKDSTYIIDQQGLSQISDAGKVEAEVIAVINSNRPAVADYKAGKVQSLKFLMGQVMRATKGRAAPQLVSELLKKKLEEE